MKKSRIAYVCAAAVLLAAAVFSGCENAAGGSDAGGSTGGTGGGGSIENVPEVDTDPDAAAKLTGSWYREGQTEPSLILEEDGTGIDYENPMTWTASETELQITKTEDFTPGEVTWQFKKESDSSLIFEGTTFTAKGNNTWSGTMDSSPATLTMTDTTFRLDMTDGKSGQMVTGTVDINTNKLTANRTINIMTYSYQLSADENTLKLVSSSSDGTENTDTYTRQPQA